MTRRSLPTSEYAPSGITHSPRCGFLVLTTWTGSLGVAVVERHARDAGRDAGARGAGEHGVDVGQRTDHGRLPRGPRELARGLHLGEHRSGRELGVILGEQGIGSGRDDGPLLRGAEP